MRARLAAAPDTMAAGEAVIGRERLGGRGTCGHNGWQAFIATNRGGRLAEGIEGTMTGAQNEREGDIMLDRAEIVKD